VPTLSDEFTELLLPVKLLEYVHMGLPVVTSRLPVIERYFSPNEVRYFEPGSAASLAEAVADVLAHPDEAHERAQRAIVRLCDFAWAEQKQVYLGLVDRLVRQGARA
jgi:glycosyltransferase involved in cell wall biosynthesis